MTRSEDEQTRATLVCLVAVLAGFKVVTSLLILVVFPSLETALVVLGLSAIWICVGIWWAAARAHAPLRLLRARRRRRQLVRQEWRVD